MLVIGGLIVICLLYLVISMLHRRRKAKRAEASMLINNFEKDPPATAEGPLSMLPSTVMKSKGTLDLTANNMS